MPDKNCEHGNPISMSCMQCTLAEIRRVTNMRDRLVEYSDGGAEILAMTDELAEEFANVPGVVSVTLVE